MERPNRAILTGALLVVLALLAGVSLASGGFFLNKYEGDTLHLMQIVIRITQGEVPHLDFETPIGLFAFLPIALFVKAGFGIGHALHLAQTLVAIVLFPAIWWVSYSRFRGGWAYLFGVSVLVLVLALVHGEAALSVSFSMHYNRWAWAVAFLVIAGAMMPNESEPHPALDGLVIGLGLAVLALVKVTYFAAFILPVAVGLIARGEGRAFLWALISGLVLAGLVTVFMGVDFWFAYLNDLQTVAHSQIRPKPGDPLSEVLAAPAYLGGSLALLAGVIFLRQAGRTVEGLVLLLLVPGFVYVTWQNFGNDPEWLMLLGLMLIGLTPLREQRNGLGWDLRKALQITGVAAFAFILPSFLNMAWSPFRHFSVERADYLPVLPGSGVNEDVRMADIRVLQVNYTTAADGPDSPFAAYTDTRVRDEPTVFRGETLPECSLAVGIVPWFTTVSADLKSSGFGAGHRVFAAGILTSYWLYGAFEPLDHGAPWYYGGLPGIEDADYVIVPLCPIVPSVRREILAELEARNLPLTEVRRTALYILYEIERGGEG